VGKKMRAGSPQPWTEKTSKAASKFTNNGISSL
jgi:hypothetical protein